MPYRADAEALRSRCEILEKELGDVRRRASELEALKRTEADVARELAKAKALLESLGARGQTAPSLDGVRIASPCKASWDDMVGDERVRFCGKCEKNVYDLSAMSRAEAEALLATHEGQLCARIYRRADGTVMTTDCPVGVRAKRVRRLAIVAVGGGALAALSGAALTTTVRQGAITTSPPGQGQHLMGDVQEVPAAMGSVSVPMQMDSVAPAQPAAPRR